MVARAKVSVPATELRIESSHAYTRFSGTSRHVEPTSATHLLIFQRRGLALALATGRIPRISLRPVCVFRLPSRWTQCMVTIDLRAHSHVLPALGTSALPERCAPRRTRTDCDAPEPMSGRYRHTGVNTRTPLSPPPSPPGSESSRLVRPWPRNPPRRKRRLWEPDAFHRLRATATQPRFRF